MPTIRNITQKNQTISGKVVPPYGTIEVSASELLNLHSMINHNMIIVENFDPSLKQIKEVVMEEINEQQEELKKEDNINMEKYEQTKEELIDAFFAFYMEKELTKEQLETIKLFYISIGPTSSIGIKTKTLLNDVDNIEDLIVVLLNHVYPEFLKKQMDKSL